MVDVEPSPPPVRRAPPAPSAKGFQLSQVITLAIASLLACTFFFAAVPRDASDRIRRMQAPVQTVERLFERDLEVSDAIAASSPWLARTLEIVLGWSNDPLRAASDAYGEVYAAMREPAQAASASSEPTAATLAELAQLQLRRAVLLAEAHDIDGAVRALQIVEDDDPALANLVRHAYGLTPSVDAPMASDIEVRGLRPGWSRDRLLARLAERSGDAGNIARAQADELARNERWRERAIALAIAFAVPLALGLVVLCAWLLRNRPPIATASVPIPPPWSFERGFAILVRAAFAGLSVAILLEVIDTWLEFDAAALWVTLIASVPMVWWIHTYLTRPAGLSLSTTFGLRPVRSNVLAWAGIVLTVIAIDQLGLVVLDLALRASGVEGHWSDRAYEDLLWSSVPVTALRVVDGAVWAPLFEEIGCRGLLFLTLRKRLGASSAALASALIFSSVHFYSPAGFVSVAWSGFVWAMAVERCRSLVPGIVAHALNNALLLAAFWALYR